MGIILANRDAPSRCTATDCLVSHTFCSTCLKLLVCYHGYVTVTSVICVDCRVGIFTV